MSHCRSCSAGRKHLSTLGGVVRWHRHPALVFGTKQQPQPRKCAPFHCECKPILTSYLKANVHGDTPLHVAARESHHNCISLLLTYGADSTIQNHEKDTPLNVSNDLLTLAFHSNRKQQSMILSENHPILSLQKIVMFLWGFYDNSDTSSFLYLFNFFKPNWSELFSTQLTRSFCSAPPSKTRHGWCSRWTNGYGRLASSKTRCFPSTASGFSAKICRAATTRWGVVFRPLLLRAFDLFRRQVPITCVNAIDHAPCPTQTAKGFHYVCENVHTSADTKINRQITTLQVKKVFWLVRKRWEAST